MEQKEAEKFVREGLRVSDKTLSVRIEKIEKVM